jgi:hypothetical protein
VLGSIRRLRETQTRAVFTSSSGRAYDRKVKILQIA